MIEQRIHTQETAPEAAQIYLSQATEKFGFIPNLIGAMAQAPAVVAGYMSLGQAFERSSLTPIEQQVVALTVSFIHECTYCMSGHSMLAEMAGLDALDLQALRNGTPLANPRLEALRHYTRQVVLNRGLVSRQDIDHFISAGYTRQQVLEVNLGVVYKTLSNYTHHIQPVPLDPPVVKSAWSPSAATRGGEAKLLILGWLRQGSAAELAKYQAAAGPIMKRYGGRPLMRLSPQAALSGKPADVVVAMGFPSAEACARPFKDPEYLALLPLRDRVFERLDLAVLSPES